MSYYFTEKGLIHLNDGEAPNDLIQMARFLRDFGMWHVAGQTERPPPPASKKALENLKETKITEKNKQCPVCLKEIEIGTVSKTMPCKHSFHTECIMPWLEKTNSCPLCAYELPTDDEDYEIKKKEKVRAVQRKKDMETLHDSMFS